MITVFSYNNGESRFAKADALPDRDNLPEVLWIDLEAPTPEEDTLIFEKFFPIHPLSLEDITRPRRQPEQPPHFPKVEEFPDYLFVIVNPLSPVAAETHLGLNAVVAARAVNSQLSAILTEQILITHHLEPLVAITKLHSYLQRHQAQARRGPDYLYHLILDDMVDQYAPVLDRVDNAIDSVERQVFTRPSRRLLVQMLQLKRGIIGLRKTMIYEREILARLSRGEFQLIDERETVYYRNVYDHLIRFTELIEASREMIMDLMQTHLAAQGNKLNEIMKVLAMISTTILPMTLIAGIYGMNFEKNVWPDFKESAFGFPLALAMMAVSGAASFVLFRWMKWI